MNTAHNIRSGMRQSGFTIVEIMVSMLLGLILMLGVVSLMVGNKRSFNEMTEMSRLQENARLAIQFLIQDIRMAGYTGCADDLTTVDNHVNGTGSDDNLLSMDYPVEGVDSASSPKHWEGSESTEIIGNMTAGTDGISIRYLAGNGIAVIPPYMPTTSAALQLAVNNGLFEGEIVAVSDCSSADIFQITGPTNPSTSGTINHNTGTGSPGNATKDFGKSYEGDAEIVRFVAARYYIGDLDGDGVSSLYRYIFAVDSDDQDADGDTTERMNVSQELIQGVENMQLLFGNGTTFTSADNIAPAGWADVDSVKISLLMRTEDEIGSDVNAATYSMLGQTITPTANLRVRRRVFNTTVEIRNR